MGEGEGRLQIRARHGYPHLVYFINVFVAKLGTAATGKFLSRKKEIASVQRCQIKQHFRVAKKLLNLLNCGGAVGGGDSGGLTLARHGYPHLVLNDFGSKF
jgi:hypothetical protein